MNLTPPPDSELLLASDVGGIEVGSVGGSVAVLGVDRWPVLVEGIVQLDANQAASISEGDGVIVRNMADTPVALLVMVIEETVAPGGAELLED